MTARSDRRDSGSGEQRSLFGEILDWMLAPLLFIWPLSIAVTNHVASDIADVPHDQVLTETLRAVARLVRIADGRVQLSLPSSARALLRAGEPDAALYQVRDPTGRVVAGDRDIPPPALIGEAGSDSVRLRDDDIHGEEIRVAYQFMRLGSDAAAPRIVVQVAESRAKRRELAGRIVSGVLLPQFAIIPLAVILAYLGLSRGIAPLDRLQELIERRRPGDLSPIADAGMPAELRPLILAFNDMIRRLEENLQAQQRFIADAAHQMRTPITGLKMQAALALHADDPAELRAALERIDQSTERAAHLIHQLLALARAEASFEQLDRRDVVDLERELTAVCADLVPQALAKEIDFGTELAGEPLRVEGNALQLRELMKNLVDNAIKYTPAGGRVTARTRAGARAVIEIEDTGIGIAEHERERVFERFHRSLGSGVEGSGLGLAIVREIAELHRATVDLLPNPGGGTIARVALPRAPGRRVDDAPPPDAFPIA